MAMYDELKICDSATFSKTMSETDIYTFAGITGDMNPAHVDAVAAAEGMFKQRIAHGMLSASFTTQGDDLGAPTSALAPRGKLLAERRRGRENPPGGVIDAPFISPVSACSTPPRENSPSKANTEVGAPSFTGTSMFHRAP